MSPHPVRTRALSTAIGLSLAVLGPIGLTGSAQALDHRPGHPTPPGHADDGPGRPGGPKPVKAKPDKPDKPDKPGRPADPGSNGHHGDGNSGQGGGRADDDAPPATPPAPPSPGTPETPADGGDPPGNNGTVKIAPLGDFDGIPDNTPHPGCSFLVEWYGFDEGDDVVSTVTFAMQAPTDDVVLSVDGPATVDVGGDPASGAGTDTGLDGRQAYTLAFDGAPHPKQGYHVRLTVSTPRSLGNDTKTKVFWVEPCAGSRPTQEPATDPVATDPGGRDGSTPDPVAVLGVNGQRPVASPRQVAIADVASETPEVPTAVDAGEAGTSSLDVVSSPPGLLLLGTLLATALGAVVLQRRSRA